MKRKIIKLGQATLVTSLPSKWAQKHNLKQGDEIEIKEEGHKLILSSEKLKEHSSLTVDVSKLNPLVRKSLQALYIRGIDELTLTTDTPSHIEKLGEFPLPHFLAYEIIEQTKNKVIIKDFSTEQMLNFDSVIRRVYLLINNAFQELTDALNNKETNLTFIADADININKFSFLLQRTLYKKGYKEEYHTPAMYQIVTYLEDIGDTIKSLAIYTTENKMSYSPPTIEFIKSLQDIFREYQKLFFKFDNSLLSPSKVSFFISNKE